MKYQTRRKIIVLVIITIFLYNSNSMVQQGFSRNNEIERSNFDNKTDKDIKLNTYTPIDSNPFYVKENMELTPIFTPDNALDKHAEWIAKANSTIEIQNPYIKFFDDRDETNWNDDSNPIVRELVKADARGVDIRVQIDEDSDTDFVGEYLNQFDDIEVRYMGSQSSSPDDNWISNTHNKLLMIDDEVVIISSINFSENAFLNNREAGMIIKSSSVTGYFMKFFEEDWEDGELLPTPSSEVDGSTDQLYNYTIDSFTNTPATTFTGTYNVSAYTNPDSASKHVINYLKSASESIYVSMYTISRMDIIDTLIDLKENNPNLDIQVLISRDRIGPTEDADTFEAAEKLTENLIPVYNSTDQLRYYHNKYWIIDQKHTFIYSGNWSPRSLTSEQSDYTSGEANRDMGIAVHNAPDIADFIKNNVWDEDIAVASAWELPAGVTQTSFESTEIVSGEVTLKASVNGLTNPELSYRFGPSSFTEGQLVNSLFSKTIDTTQLDNGIHTYEVKVISDEGTFTDSVTINLVNIPSKANFRLLITEIHPDPEVVDDDEGEFFEITNSFNFDLMIENWKVGEPDDYYSFEEGYTIPGLTSLIIARDKNGFQSGYGKEADFELSMSLANTNGVINLLDYKGEYIDVVAYGDAEAEDGSETVETPGSGQSLNRNPIYLDTNSASDFSIGSPTPKEDFDYVPFDEESSDELAISPFISFLGIIGIMILRRKKVV